MRINLASVLVDDQEKALRFYTETLGFLKKNDVPLGEHRWLTVVSPDAPDGPELLLHFLFVTDHGNVGRPFRLLDIKHPPVVRQRSIYLKRPRRLLPRLLCVVGYGRG